MRNALSILVAAMLASSGSAAGKPLTATAVEQGRLEGVSAGPVSRFLGIPFAAPPTTTNRWRAPAPPAFWRGVRRADRFAANCLQPSSPGGRGPWTEEYFSAGPTSEDCLYLNVWTAATSVGEKLPILFFIHGGGYSLGSGSVPIYDGAALARRGVVFVSINYRLGPYGFLAHPALAAESPVGASGNYGLLDQIQALKWVKSNISAFGGDPDKVTIMGESAGAASAHHLIASPLADGLFSRAIAMSGSGMGLSVPTRTAAENSGKSLLEAAGVTSIADLRQLDATRIDAAAKTLGPAHLFWPSIDGWVLPSRGIIDRNTNDVPVLTGMTASEMTGVNPKYGKMTPKAWSAELVRAYGVLAEDMEALYPAADAVAANKALLDHTRDRGLASMAFWALNRLQAGSTKSVFAYLWSHVPPGTSPRFGAFHTSPMPYAFGTLDKFPRQKFKRSDRKISEQLQLYLVNFVKWGNPNGKGLTHWPTFTGTSMDILEIDGNMTARRILAPSKVSIFKRHVDSGGTLGMFFGLF